MTTFFVPGVPAPQGSKSISRAGKLYESSKKVGPWREAVAWAAKAALPRPLEGPVTLKVEFVLPRPKGWGQKREDPMIQTPDADKLLRSTCDGLTGPAVVNDSQFIDIHIFKRRARHGEATGAFITIEGEQR